MSILTTSYLGHSFGSLDLFGGISVSIPNDGKIGLVGPNGIGKTTLLLILAGVTKPASGNVHLAHGAKLGYLPQESAQAFVGQNHSVFDEMLTVFERLRADESKLRRLEETMGRGKQTDELLEQYSRLQEQFELDGGYDYELRIKRVLTGLGFGPDHWHLSLEHLSGGQKTRVLLARLLLETPDLLILDEPTNHLDMEAVEWLEGTLRLWDGAVLLVSHDRYFLDKATNTIWEMDRSGIESYRGNYSAYLHQRQERWERRQQEFETLRERMEKEMDFIRRNISGQRTQMAQGKLSRLSREVEAVRAGGLSVLHALKSKGWLQVTTEVDLRRPAAKVDELQQRISELHRPTRPPSLHVELKPSYRSGDIVLRANDLEIGYPGTSLFCAAEIELHRQECAALIGPNGSGKTTFLRTILEQNPPLAGDLQLGASLKIGYFAQSHDGLAPEETVLDELLRHRHMNISEARNYLARYLFRRDDVFKRVSDLSGGERGRLALAILALQDANFLLLDEPTNHLDIQAQEVLQEALEQFEGTILLVTHDRYLVDRMASQIWELDQGHLRIYACDYQEYLAQREKEKAFERELDTSRQNGNAAGTDIEASQPSKNVLRRRAEALKNVEDSITETETKLAQIGEALQQATEAQAFDKIQSLSVEYTATENQLVHLLEKWEKLAHE